MIRKVWRLCFRDDALDSWSGEFKQAAARGCVLAAVGVLLGVTLIAWLFIIR